MITGTLIGSDAASLKGHALIFHRELRHRDVDLTVCFHSLYPMASFAEKEGQRNGVVPESLPIALADCQAPRGEEPKSLIRRRLHERPGSTPSRAIPQDRSTPALRS